LTVSEQPGSQTGESPAPGSVVPLAKSPGFWVVMRDAALLGVVLAFVALAFLGLLRHGTKLWFTLPSDPGWFDGSLWWVAVTGGAGVLVGVLRRAFRVPADLPGTFKELKDERVEPSTAPGAVVVSLVSLVGGASLGPEDALAKIGGGLGTWISERRKLGDDLRATNTLSGIGAAFGGLLSSSLPTTAFVIELARPPARRFADVLIATLLSSTVAFGVYYPIAGSTFVGIFAVPPFKYEDWQLLAAVPLGLFAALLSLIMVVAVGVMKKLAAPLAGWPILRATLGGVLFGLVGVALPLTLFTGTDQLPTIIDDGTTLGAGLLIAVVFAKMLTFALCEATGFIGGPVLVSLFLGGTAGTALHVLIPGLPEGLAFAAVFAALPGALVLAPFSVIIFAAVTTEIGTLQLAPVIVAVVTSYLAISGTGTLMALARGARKSPGPETKPAQPSKA
jgi:H+/Cl- antiporter ClcA